MTYLIDTYGMPSDSELRMAGCVGASRYIAHDSGKHVTSAQVRHIHALGKTVSLNFEDSAGNAKGGTRQGRTDATFTVDTARSLGAPHGVGLFFSVDYEAHTGQSAMGVILNYFRGVAPIARKAGYLVGAYGDKDVIAALLNAKLIDLGWQTAAWSYGARDARAVLFQDRFTQGYDVNEIEHPFYGGWTPHGAQTNPTEDPLAGITTNDIANADWHALITNPLTGKAVPAYQYLTSINTQAYQLLQANIALTAAVRALTDEVASIKSKVGA